MLALAQQGAFVGTLAQAKKGASSELAQEGGDGEAVYPACRFFTLKRFQLDPLQEVWSGVLSDSLPSAWNHFLWFQEHLSIS